MIEVDPAPVKHVPVKVERVAEASLPTQFADFRLRAYRASNGKEHVALFLALDTRTDEVPLVRVHSECLTGDALFSQRCDCGPQLHESMRLVGEAGRGVIVYLRQEGRGIGLMNKIRAYALQDQGDDTVDANRKLGFPADGRDYLPAVAILRDLGVTRLRLLTNNPRKVEALTRAGIEVVERLPLIVGVNPHNRHYLATKAARLGHLMHVDD
ncbi:MAG TPA: GTP cyclohydrolase II [Nevskiaceae bacterium]|nr:GTP cyclohydrolase II [Nevskiaceae bacterium]